MSIRNLDSLFRPSSIALIGASTTPGSVGEVLARNLYRSGFAGPILPVSPKHRSVEGVLSYPNVGALPLVPDLAVIATPPPAVPGIVAELASRGTKAAVVITAGFGEIEGGGKDLQQSLLDAAKPHLLRVVGPNCLGVMVPAVGLNASFGHLEPLPGKVALVTQSGAVAASVLDWATARRIGFSHLVSLGDMADVDFGDMLDFLALDPETRAVLLYVEAVTNPRKFVSAARAAARGKPVIVIKGGRYTEGARAAASHTGALAGSDDVYEAVFRRTGLLRVFELDALFDAVETLDTAPAIEGDRLAIVTNGGGLGVLGVDALIERGGRLADLSPQTLERLSEQLPPTWSRGNPVDIVGDAPPQRFTHALSTLLAAPEVDAVLVLHCPNAVSSSTGAARAVIDLAKEARRPVLTSWVGGTAVEEAHRLFAEHSVPTYATPTRAVRAFLHLVHHRRNQALLLQTPLSSPDDYAPDRAAVRSLIAGAFSLGRSWLTGPEAGAVLRAYGVPCVRTEAASTPERAAEIAAKISGPVVLKILSPDILHKSDVGGVVLGLARPEAVREAAEAMAERARQARPEARLEGFTVEPMVHRPGAFELIVGMAEDPQFGPVMLFGHGGTAVEVVDDTALALPPLNGSLARDLVERTRISRLLRGYRDRPGANLDAVTLALVRVSQLVTDFAEVAELDINPLLADASGVVALDVRLRVEPSSGTGPDRLAIRPYPRELEETIALPDGRELLLRPVRPEDELLFQVAYTRLSAEEIRMRFIGSMKALTHPLAARLTQIDYDREMALVLIEQTKEGEPEFQGDVRIAADPDRECAEFAVLVRQALTGRGLGRHLMGRIIDYARTQGIRELVGYVLRENERMRRLCRGLGFQERGLPEDVSLLKVSLRL